MSENNSKGIPASIPATVKVTRYGHHHNKSCSTFKMHSTEVQNGKQAIANELIANYIMKETRDPDNMGFYAKVEIVRGAYHLEITEKFARPPYNVHTNYEIDITME